jgi:CubicO group peptidase (beta-lactamase class C family)
MVLLLGLMLFSKCGEEGTQEVIYPKIAHTIEVAFDSTRVDEIDHYFTKEHKAGRFNGVVLIAKRDSVFRAVYGFSNYRTKDSLQIDTRFQLASVSKPITALAVMQLVEQGKIRLTDSLEMYFPEWPYPGITIKMLLSHRSGLTNYMYHTDDWFTQRDEIPICNSEAIRMLCEKKPEMYYRPDTTFDYNNTNFMLLAAVVERVTGMDFETYMLTQFFRPLGMLNTFIKSDMEVPQDGLVARGHDKRRRTIAPYYLSGTTGDKGVYTTAEDLYTLHKALLKGEIVQDSTLNLMFTPSSKFNRRGGSYGLGWRLNQRDDGSVITYHNGWWRGFRTYFIHDADEEAVVIVLTNWLRGPFIPQDDLLKLAGL